jgi:UDP-N-acetylglucosamine--N-acetylmuramyl-(pentapeptide) pyrophosphoryl-undecaprenol N-acetylglucosamine transferase
VVLACGGSAGHVRPALAVQAAWADVDPAATVVFVGAHEGLERTLVETHGGRFRAIPVRPLFGVSPWERLRAVGSALRGVAAARRLLAEEDADVVVGFGGYVAAPVVAAAASRRIVTLVHEANADLGVGNRLVAPLADVVLVGAGGTRARTARRTETTGVPVDPAIVGASGAERAAPDASRRLRVLVSGGSYGSPFLDEHVPPLLGRVAAAGCLSEARHVAGRGDVGRIEDAYRSHGIPASVEAFVGDIVGAYRWADVAIVSAGAVTLAETAVMGLPALVVPHGRVARNHQVANARRFAEATGTHWVGEDAWDEAAVAAHVVRDLVAPAAWRARAGRLRSAARPDAAQAVVRAALAAVTRRGRSAGARELS